MIDFGSGSSPWQLFFFFRRPTYLSNERATACNSWACPSRRKDGETGLKSLRSRVQLKATLSLYVCSKPRNFYTQIPSIPYLRSLEARPMIATNPKKPPKRRIYCSL